ncbi:PaaI family thioesterase [Roseibacterium sp. SDUM158017]|uniref:PaaI family thioesterase n=1 Tax=Roseicyclus salinarum TaxID=3036773 RepID=UPI002414DBC5|nr:PaaI family thioesterase [Roseibacterium sp. SDUM158017]MDG4648270.1 PaaI family thioesterase [Roseibacterium sp. SDUM158017]
MPQPFFVATHGDLPDPATLASMSGLDAMRRVAEGTLPQAPIAKLLNFRLSDVSKGEAVFHGAPLFEHLNPMGGVHGGWYGALLDSCMGCAVMTGLAPGRAYTTLEYKVNLVRAIPEGHAVIATGRVVHGGRTTAVAMGEICCATTGRPFATGSTTCLIMDAA